jgi:hypothetical protein
MSTDAAGMCREIVVASATTIQGRKFVTVEGWQAIAIAHGCVAGAREVERVEGGVRAIGEVRRMSDGQLIATAEGFVGEDETTWYGGKDKRGKVHDKRADYAIRAMAQTRAISRACRSAFAHVVVMMKANLATTPAEEMGHEPSDVIDHNPETGEIIEAEALREPAAREKLDGPHTSKTALRTAVNEIIAKARNAASIRELDAIKEEHKHTINQARRDWPLLIEGDPRISEDIGLKGVFEMKRAELTAPEESLAYQLLVSTLNEVTSSNELQSWLNKNGEVVGDLDGEEGRKFEAIYDEKERALKLLDQATVGA